MISCKGCGTKLYSRDIAKKDVCITCMEYYEKIHKVLNGTPKNIDDLSVIITAHTQKLCVEILLYEGVEGEVYTHISVPMRYLGHINSPTYVSKEIQTQIESLCEQSGYNMSEVTHKILNLWVRDRDLVRYLKPTTYIPTPPSVVEVLKSLPVYDKAVVKLPKAIVVLKSPLEVFVGNLLDRYYK